jgi:hypothetical protein
VKATASSGRLVLLLVVLVDPRRFEGGSLGPVPLGPQQRVQLAQSSPKKGADLVQRDVRALQVRLRHERAPAALVHHPELAPDQRVSEGLEELKGPRGESHRSFDRSTQAESIVWRAPALFDLTEEA